MNEIIYQVNHKIIYKDGDKAIKTFSESYSTMQVLNEALNQERVAKEGLATPKVYEVKHYEGRLGIEMDYIDGENLADLIEKNPNDKEKYMDIFVQTHEKILSNKVFGLYNSYGKIKSKIFATKYKETVKYNLFYKLRTLDFTRDVNHGDYSLSNVMIDKNGKVVVLDWAHAAFGNRIFDIAVTYALFLADDRKDLGDIYLEKICECEKISMDRITDVLALALIYIIDRNKQEKQEKIYYLIDELMKLVEGYYGKI